MSGNNWLSISIWFYGPTIWQYPMARIKFVLQYGLRNKTGYFKYGKLDVINMFLCKENVC